MTCPGVAPLAVLLERGPALRAVTATVEATRGGASSVLFLLGEAGLGKTSLLTRARSAASGLSIGWAEGVAAETALPFGLLGQALGPLGVLGELEATFGLGSAQARTSVYYRCARALRDAPAAAPLLLLIDDLHWADSDSLGLLAFLLRRLRDNPVGVIATMRPWPSEATALAEEMKAAGRASIERLAPLGAASAAQLVSRATGRRLPRVELEPLVASCGGNPLLLEQAAAAVRARARTDAWDSPLRQLLARFAGLPPSVLAVVKAASVVGIRFWPQLAGAVAEVDEATVSFALGVLLRSGLARALPDGQVEFAHPLFAQALYDGIDPPERSRLHAVAMRALLALGADPALAAAHAIAGHLMGDDLAIETLDLAGRAALASGGLESAVGYLSAAVDLTGHRVKPQLLLDLAEAQLALGRRERVMVTCQQVIHNSPSPSVRADALVMLARLAWSGGESEELVRRYREAVVAAEGTDRLVDVLGQAVMVLGKERGPAEVASWSQRLRGLSAGVSAAQRTLVDLAWGTVAALAGDVAGTEAIRSAVGPANLRSVMGSAAPTAFPLMLAAAFDSRLFVERFDEADELFTAAWEIAEGQGALMHMEVLAVIQAAGNWWRGRLAGAHKVIDEIAVIKTAAGMTEVSGPRATLLALLASEEGDEAVALAECDKAEHHQSAQSPWFRTQLWRVRAELALDAGRVNGAVKLARNMRDLADRLGVLEPCWAPWADVAMLAFLRSGLLEESRALVDHLERASSVLPCRWPRSVAASGRAGLAEAEGDLDNAEQCHRLAVELLEGTGLPLRRARALLGYGRFLRRNGHPVLARTPLARALEESEACGGRRLAAQAKAELQASGGRRRRVSSTELSAQERHVAALAAKGATNDEIASSLFISAKTVEHHLTSAYSKLGVRSRKELQGRWEAEEPRPGTTRALSKTGKRSRSAAVPAVRQSPLAR